MNRYFLELAYKGHGFAGFQVQQNAPTIQWEVEKAFLTYFRRPVALTGSSRTDTGVHALQNYFHFDWESEIDPQCLYNLNAILPAGIVLRSIKKMAAEAHCRFDARSRVYRYYCYNRKDPFLDDRAYYYPYPLNEELLRQAAGELLLHTDFASFSKRGSQVKTTQCQLMRSEWVREGGCLVYEVEANRFLRGMVRGLVATMLRVGVGKLKMDEFRGVILAKDNRVADFAVPGHGLFLMEVNFGEGYWGARG